jgi:2-keto-4-pentenoate hydratase/2-oxohepta-3-ene-1,7-dioic acid hydratase in catechol pathway
VKLANIAVSGDKAMAVEVEGTLRRVPVDFLGGGGHPIRSIEDLLTRQGPDGDFGDTAHQIVAAAAGFPAVDPGTFRWRPVVEHPEKILCVGLNYRSHVAETRSAVSEMPVLFGKFPNTLAAAGDEIPIPPASAQMDYEAELVIVIGKTCRGVSVSDALTAVLGYTCGNDVSARDLQHRSSQWLIGKSLDGFGPVGPMITTADEVGDPQALSIQLTRNGTVCQSARTDQMIFSCAEVVAYASTLFTLQPGDLIFTGTPDGVILGKPPEERRWIEPGDTVTVTIEKLGSLTNTFTAAR